MVKKLLSEKDGLVTDLAIATETAVACADEAAAIHSTTMNILIKISKDEETIAAAEQSMTEYSQQLLDMEQRLQNYPAILEEAQQKASQGKSKTTQDMYLLAIQLDRDEKLALDELLAVQNVRKQVEQELSILRSQDSHNDSAKSIAELEENIALLKNSVSLVSMEGLDGLARLIDVVAADDKMQQDTLTTYLDTLHHVNTILESKQEALSTTVEEFRDLQRLCSNLSSLEIADLRDKLKELSHIQKVLILESKAALHMLHRFRDVYIHSQPLLPTSGLSILQDAQVLTNADLDEKIDEIVEKSVYTLTSPNSYLSRILKINTSGAFGFPAEERVPFSPGTSKVRDRPTLFSDPLPTLSSTYSIYRASSKLAKSSIESSAADNSSTHEYSSVQPTSDADTTKAPFLEPVSDVLATIRSGHSRASKCDPIESLEANVSSLTAAGEDYCSEQGVDAQRHTHSSVSQSRSVSRIPVLRSKSRVGKQNLQGASTSESGQLDTVPNIRTETAPQTEAVSSSEEKPSYDSSTSNPSNVRGTRSTIRHKGKHTFSESTVHRTKSARGRNRITELLFANRKIPTVETDDSEESDSHPKEKPTIEADTEVATVALDKKLASRSNSPRGSKQQVPNGTIKSSHRDASEHRTSEYLSLEQSPRAGSGHFPGEKNVSDRAISLAKNDSSNAGTANNNNVGNAAAGGAYESMLPPVRPSPFTAQLIAEALEGRVRSAGPALSQLTPRRQPLQQDVQASSALSSRKDEAYGFRMTPSVDEDSTNKPWIGNSSNSSIIPPASSAARDVPDASVNTMETASSQPEKDVTSQPAPNSNLDQPEPALKFSKRPLTAAELLEYISHNKKDAEVAAFNGSFLNHLGLPQNTKESVTATTELLVLRATTGTTSTLDKAGNPTQQESRAFCNSQYHRIESMDTKLSSKALESPGSQETDAVACGPLASDNWKHSGYVSASEAAHSLNRTASFFSNEPSLSNTANATSNNANYPTYSSRHRERQAANMQPTPRSKSRVPPRVKQPSSIDVSKECPLPDPSSLQPSGPPEHTPSYLRPTMSRKKYMETVQNERDRGKPDKPTTTVSAPGPASHITQSKFHSHDKAPGPGSNRARSRKSDPKPAQATDDLRQKAVISADDYVPDVSAPGSNSPLNKKITRDAASARLVLPQWVEPTPVRLQTTATTLPPSEQSDQRPALSSYFSHQDQNYSQLAWNGSLDSRSRVPYTDHNDPNRTSLPPSPTLVQITYKAGSAKAHITPATPPNAPHFSNGAFQSKSGVSAQELFAQVWGQGPQARPDGTTDERSDARDIQSAQPLIQVRLMNASHDVPSSSPSTHHAPTSAVVPNPQNTTATVRIVASSTGRVVWNQDTYSRFHNADLAADPSDPPSNTIAGGRLEVSMRPNVGGSNAERPSSTLSEVPVQRAMSISYSIPSDEEKQYTQQPSAATTALGSPNHMPQSAHRSSHSQVHQSYAAAFNRRLHSSSSSHSSANDATIDYAPIPEPELESTKVVSHTSQANPSDSFTSLQSTSKPSQPIFSHQTHYALPGKTSQQDLLASSSMSYARDIDARALAVLQTADLLLSPIPPVSFNNSSISIVERSISPTPFPSLITLTTPDDASSLANPTSAVMSSAYDSILPSTKGNGWRQPFHSVAYASDPTEVSSVSYQSVLAEKEDEEKLRIQHVLNANRMQDDIRDVDNSKVGKNTQLDSLRNTLTDAIANSGNVHHYRAHPQDGDITAEVPRIGASASLSADPQLKNNVGTNANLRDIEDDDAFAAILEAASKFLRDNHSTA